MKKAIEEARKSYEHYMEHLFYNGVASIEEDWSEERGTYKDFAHHLGWCIWRDLVEEGLHD